MDIGFFTSFPAFAGKGAVSVPGDVESGGPEKIKPEVAVNSSTNNNGGSTPGTKLPDAVQVQRHEPLANVYVVSDQRFTIFKDALGYVTRYTSLVDGHVTYIPDQDVARFLEAQQQARIRIDA